MANQRLSMRKLVEILRLQHEGLYSRRAIARMVGASPTTIGDYLSRAKLAGLSYLLPEGMDEAAVDALLFPPTAHTKVPRPEPDWPSIHQEMRRKGVTLELLWQEYKAAAPEGLQYSTFCEHYRAWRKQLTVTLRQQHTPAEKLFVDYAGQTVDIVDQHTGEISSAQIFVAVLGASNYTYLEATHSQKLPDWIGSHVRAFNYFGGVPLLLVPDNLRSGVSESSLYEPDLNPTYQDLAQHYGVAVMPARPYKPRDKAKAEVGVQIVERWVLARLRHQRFFSLQELNRELRECLETLNQRPFKKLEGCRREWFEQMDRPALQPLPERPYQYAEWSLARVGVDYHVEVARHFYSVPFLHARQQVNVRLTESCVEIFLHGQRIASHVRSPLPHRHSTVEAHMPPQHQAVSGWTADKLLARAQRIGPKTETVVQRLLQQRAHPQQAFRSCLGVFRLGEKFGESRLEAACQRALRQQTVSWKSLQSILKLNLDQQTPPETARAPAADHSNVRGAGYFSQATRTLH